MPPVRDSVITISLLDPVRGHAVQSWEFDGAAVNRIGRAKTNDVILNDSQVSRVHGELTRTDAGWNITPLGRNGVAISGRAHALVDSAYRLWNTEMIPALSRAGIVIVRPEELSPVEQAALDERFRTDIFPVLTPVAIDPGHPFPHLRNKTINLGIGSLKFKS